MRISSNTFQMQWLNAVRQQQEALVGIQRQINTGLRVSTAVDDPVGAAQVVLLKQGMDRLDNFATNSETARRRLGLEENALNQVTDTLSRVRELTIQAGGGTLPPESIKAIAIEVRALFDNLMAAANSQDGEGRYLFSGNRVQSKSFELIGGSVIYNGDDGLRSQRIAENRTIQEADPGSKVFSAIRDGNGTFAVDTSASNTGTAYFSSATLVDPGAWVQDTYTIGFPTTDTYAIADGSGAVVSFGPLGPGDSITFNGVSITLEGVPAAGDTFVVRPSRNQDLFSSVLDLADSLEAFSGNPVDRAQLNSGLNSALMNMDQALANISNTRSQVGARLNIIDGQRDANEATGLQLAEALSNVRDVDYAEALSTIEQQLFSLEAAQKTFARTRTSSLFNII